VIAVDNLTKRYGARTAVDGLTFAVEPRHGHWIPRADRLREADNQRLILALRARRMDRDRQWQALRGTGAGDEARTRDPELGKVPFQFRIQEGSNLASKRLLTPNFHGARR
jgi:hypothetical protein